MNSFCIIANESRCTPAQLAHVVSSVGGLGGRSVVLKAKSGGTADYSVLDGEKEKPEAAIVLGGDGTIIRAARELSVRGIPLLGVNLGTMGFLAEIEEDDIDAALGKLSAGQYTVDIRYMIRGIVHCGGEKVCDEIALNDIVISRSGFSRVITIRTEVNGVLLDEYKGDGMIVATATGSTAYNLSAGGPILMPYCSAVAVTPICTHAMRSCGIVCPDDDRITMTIEPSKKTQDIEAFVSFDGSRGVRLGTGDIVEVMASDIRTEFLRVGDRTFLDTLRLKMR